MSGTCEFRVTARDGEARTGLLSTPHGTVATPAFMPVGTLGAVKGVSPQELEAAGAEIQLANLYHLAVRPGIGLIEARGGLHAFTGWRRPLLTDSGGFQVFSLARLRRVDDDGVTFRNHVDGGEMRLTPAGVVRDQARLGVDVGMVLDECPPWPASAGEVAAAGRRTLEWARRAREVWEGQPAALFGIVQGGVYRQQREEAAAALAALDFPGYAIGGVSVGEPEEQRREVVAWTAPALPADRPRYLMGVGTPCDLLAAVAAGVDLFDCVLPARNARHGRVFTAEGELQITNARFREDERPLAQDCSCPACQRLSRAFLHHLARAGELTAKVLLTLHNLRFYLDFMRVLGESIATGSLADFAAAAAPRLQKRAGAAGGVQN